MQYLQEALENGGSVRGINAEGQGAMPRKKIDKLGRVCKRATGQKVLLTLPLQEDGTRNLLLPIMTEEEMDTLVAAMEGKPGDLLLFAADKSKACV